MPATVRQERGYFAIIALALLFITQSLGIVMTMTQRLLPPQTAMLAAAFFSASLICAAILSTSLSMRVKGALALCAALLVAGHVMGSGGGIQALALRSAGVGMLWILALHAFFLFAPQRRKGLLLGLTVAAGELFWVALLPAVNILFSYTTEPALSGHVQKLQMGLQFCSLLLLAAAFFLRSAQEENAPTADKLSEDGAKVSVLPLLFLAATLLYILYGQASGLAFPRLGQGGIPDSAHILLLITMPLVGVLYDRGDRGWRWLLTGLAVLAFTAPALVFTVEGTLRESLYALLCVGRQGVFLVTLLLADRLLQNRKRLPLLFALAYILPTTSMAGRAIANANANAGVALEAGIALVLALAFAFLLMRLRSHLSGLSLVVDDEAPLPEPDAQLAPVTGQRAAFAASYGLSRQEIQVMEMLAQGRSTDDIAGAMQVHKKTINTYVSRMLQKTQTPNRAALMELFAAHNPISAAAVKKTSQSISA